MTQRRRWYLGAALAYLVIIAVVVWGLLGLYHASRQRLDEALGARLLAAASSAAVLVDARQVFSYSLGDSSSAPYLELLEADFVQLARQAQLAEITLCDPEGMVLAGTAAGLAKGARNSFWELDRPAVETALGGVPAATSLYQLQSTFQKSAHVPVVLADPYLEGGLVVAVLTVSGSPDFFDALDRLRRGALITGGVVLILLAAMALVLHRITLSLERSRASLLQQENLAAMGRMTAGIAHEIRNPLGIIRGAGQHLQRVLAEAGIQDEVADFIPEEVDRLDAILSGYLAFGTDGETVEEIFDPAVVMRRGTALLAEELARAGLQLEVQAPVGQARVQGDPRRLQQVLLNLLLNARDACQAVEAAREGCIEVGLHTESDQLRIVVGDNGCGLPSQPVEKLFTPFQTTKEKGSGLGLALSRKIIRGMGGSLELTPRPEGAGAQAVIRLPLVPMTSDAER